MFLSQAVLFGDAGNASSVIVTLGTLRVQAWNWVGGPNATGTLWKFGWGLLDLTFWETVDFPVDPQKDKLFAEGSAATKASGVKIVASCDLLPVYMLLSSLAGAPWIHRGPFTKLGESH